MISIEYDSLVFLENSVFVAYCPELDVSSCGKTVEQTKDMLKKAVSLFLEEAENLGTLEDILEEANFIRDSSGRWLPPKLVATEKVTI